MSANLRRNTRGLRRIDYSEANKKGFKKVDMGRPRRKKNTKAKTTKKTKEPKDKVNEETQGDRVDEENVPGPSGFELVEDLHSDMGHPSDDSREAETSDVDSDELERQNQELEELDKQIAKRRARRSNKERHERKQKMKEMRKMAEEKRKILDGLDSEDSEGHPENKRRKLSKSKDGKGVKNKKAKGMRAHKSTRLNETPIPGKKRRHKKIVHKNTDSSSSEYTSSGDEMSKVIQEVKHKSSQRSKTKNKRIKNTLDFSAGKKQKRTKKYDSSDSRDSSPDSTESSEEKSSGEDSSSDSSLRDRHSKRKQKKGKSIKSGVKAKAHKIRLKTSELCAQAVLDEEHCPGSFALEDLSFNQLVAGELEICTACEISKPERNARLRILKLLAYYASLLSQPAIIEIYKAIILKVEKGLFTWSPETVIKAENMLDRAVSKAKFQGENSARRPEKQVERGKDKSRKDLGIVLKTGEKVIYCADFNKGRCDKENNHEGKFGGKEVTKHHVCRVCLTIDKEKRSHAEGDEKCPNKGT